MADAAKLGYADIKEGAVYEFSRKITQQDVQDFARLTGDNNPLHTNPSYGAQSPFKGNIVHGMLAGSLFSTLVGMHCPGEKCLYVSQSLQFRQPLLPGDTVTVRGTVTGKSDSIRMVTLKTEIMKNGAVAIGGEARVQVLP
jgi:3-hydroxybutyryl-CoA dehydratase